MVERFESRAADAAVRSKGEWEPDPAPVEAVAAVIKVAEVALKQLARPYGLQKRVPHRNPSDRRSIGQILTE
jgi:hypothetical protein